MAGGAGPLTGQGSLRGPWMQRNYILPYILVTSLFFLWGFAYGLLDVLNKHFQNVLKITKLQSTGLQVAYFGIGYFAFSPVAAIVLRRFGYKKTIIMGLSFYSIGAILFWPVAHFAGHSSNSAIFAGFVICTGVVACGLATLEVTANSYVSVMKPSGPAAFRLQFSQSWNGVASFCGPFIASKYFFTGKNASNLTNVQFVYMAVSGLGIVMALAFAFTRLPEVSEEDLQAEADALAEATGGHDDEQLAKPFWKQVRPILGFVCQFMYVGAQVTIGSFAINYMSEAAGFSDPKAANYLSYSLIIFTVSRFISTALLTVFSAPFLLMVCAALCALFTALMGSLDGIGGVACLMATYAVMAIQYPVIFVISTEGLGRHTRSAAGLLVQGVAGGAVFPPIQGAIADHFGTKKSMWLSFPAFLYIVGFAYWRWAAKGRHFTRAAEEAHEALLVGGLGAPAVATALSLEAGNSKEKELEAEIKHIDY